MPDRLAEERYQMHYDTKRSERDIYRYEGSPVLDLALSYRTGA